MIFACQRIFKLGRHIHILADLSNILEIALVDIGNGEISSSQVTVLFKHGQIQIVDICNLNYYK